MKTRPASVHFLAKVEFSLSFELSVCLPRNQNHANTYEAIPWMYACTAIQFSNFDDLISIEVSRRDPKVDSKRRA